MREHSGWWEEVDSGQLRASTKADPLTATREVAKNSVLTIPLSFDIWSKLERWKGLMSGCLVSWLKLKSFWSVVFYCMQQKTISWSDCDIQWKSGFDTTAGDDQLCGWMEKKLQSTSQSQTCTQKKVTITVWWSAAGLIHCSFVNPSKTITTEKCAQQINEMHQNPQSLQPVLVTEWV